MQHFDHHRTFYWSAQCKVDFYKVCSGSLATCSSVSQLRAKNYMLSSPLIHIEVLVLIISVQRQGLLKDDESIIRSCGQTLLQSHQVYLYKGETGYEYWGQSYTNTILGILVLMINKYMKILFLDNLVDLAFWVPIWTSYCQ